MHTCKNCENEYEGNYCSACGQSAQVRRIDFHYLIHDIPDSVLQINHGLLFTIKSLLIRPGHSIREFISGKRIPYLKPLSFFLFTTAAYVLGAYLLGRPTLIAEFIKGLFSGMESTQSSVGTKLLNYILEYQTYFLLLYVPLFSFASYVAFIRSGYNYFEHLVLNLYIKGQQALIYLALGFWISDESALILIPILLNLFYNAWTYLQFFKSKSRLKVVLLLLLTYLLLAIIILILLIALASILKP